ncbi:tripartite tricarboxylate transporter permease [Bordetella genomosp. 4]|uniref:C4-dicarboxylate ABC transporter permease n=1 Tax=Bordetella genomosp. 4 TaxID=463044 RepID=A0A261U3I8_9BORD|nr:tripartite tricarboxylate transporter permease [Bordetella genomosp. 4]OZI55962.1 C4-dicarboxylate ABC transporter permease [Bordetella genomosp. 4]
MDSLLALLDGARHLLGQWDAMLMAVAGVALGLVVGALPGLSVAMGVAIMLPFTYGMEPLHGLLLLSGIFFGGVYGGSITAILLRIPGTPAAAATALDGYAMTRQGRAGQALGVATVSSFTGGVISVLVLIFLAPLLAQFALRFSAAESFALAVFGLSIIASISGGSVLKGLLSGFAGLLLATVGMDPLLGLPRFTGGMSELYSVPFIPIMIGLFAAAEAFKMLSESSHAAELKTAIGRILPTRETLRNIWGTVLRSSGIGTAIGIIPGAGADIAAFVAYGEAKRFSKAPETFGEGAMQGVAAAEAGANGCTGGAMLPMLTLGIPGDAVTAIMLGALTLQGIQPGPRLFQENGDLVFSLFAGLLLCYVILLVMALCSLRYVARMVQVPKSILMPLIMVLSVAGAYAIGNSMFDVGIMLVAGAIGFLMIKAGLPASPMVLGLVLGPMAESNFRRALTLSEGSYDFLYTRPITATLLAVALITMFAPALSAYRKRRRANRGVATHPGAQT